MPFIILKMHNEASSLLCSFVKSLDEDNSSSEGWVGTDYNTSEQGDGYFIDVLFFK